MERKKNTNLIAIADPSDFGLSAVRHAATLAAFFESSLTVIRHFSFHENVQKHLEHPGMQELLSTLPSSLRVILPEEDFTPEKLYDWAEKNNSIMYVIGVGREKKEAFFTRNSALKFIKPSRLPVLTVGLRPPVVERWQQVLLTVDIDRQAKEKVLWAGYFNRFGGSVIHLLHSEYRDEFLKQKLQDNLAFVDKLYGNLEIRTLEKHQVPPRTDPDTYALAHAEEYSASLLVIMTTTFKTFVDVLFGTREKQLIANSQGLPVLCINERDDLYVLCT